MTDHVWSSAGAVRNGLGVIGLCLGGLVLWAATAQLHGAVLAGGAVEVVTGGQVVQHPDGGLVGRILVRNGDRVLAGQEVLVLAGDDLREQHAALTRRLFDTRLAMDRLQATQAGAATLTLRPWILEAASSDAELTRRIAEERMHFDASRNALAERDAQLAGRIHATGATARGLARQAEALSQAAAYAATRLAERQALLERGLERRSAVEQIAREGLDLEAQIAALQARISETEGAHADLVAERARIAVDQRETSLAEFRTHATQEAELLSQLRVLDGRLSRLTLRAPLQGIVHDLQITTEGGVVGAGQALLTIVPDDQPLVLSVRVAPEQIDSVRPGQLGIISFPGLDAGMGSGLEAWVSTVSPDVIEDAGSGQRYYAVDLALSVAPEARARDLPLIPGMPVLAQIRTESRTPAAYLLAPISEFFRTALGEV